MSNLVLCGDLLPKGPQMTRKDFQLIAMVLKYARVSSADRQLIAEDFASSLRSTNERFDAPRFISAVTEGN